MTVTVEVQYAVDGGEVADNALPSARDFEQWIGAALAGRCAQGEMTIRVVGLKEGAALNETYRHRQGPTNVLSFPYGDTPDADLPLLGDLVICAPVVVREAREQGKAAQAHWAHLTVHGGLHLLGYDHEASEEARIMEDLERDILAGLGFADPYAEEKEIRAAAS